MKGKIIMEYIIEGKYNVNAICEISVSVCDYNFLVIYGKISIHLKVKYF